MWKEFVGARSSPVRNTVESGAVARFAEAIGDLAPIYLDEAAAARTVWGRRIAPPTFPRVFDFGTIEGLRLPASGIIHGEQTYAYTRPIFVGEELDCHTILVDTYEKQGREGKLTFLVYERVAAEPTGTEVMRTREVYILTEKVIATLVDAAE